MVKTIQKTIVLILMAGLGFYIYANYLSVCSQSISYSLGSIDPRFEISEEAFLKVAQETELVWESPFGEEFFTYDPDSDFKINLIFDERQQRTIDERNTRTQIGSKESQYKSIVEQYDKLFGEHKQKNLNYEAEVQAYEQRLRKYNQDVEHWNQNGGAPAREYTRLQQEKTALQREARRLETVRQGLNQEVARLNSMVSTINQMAQDLNLDVDAYNGKFGSSREFDQGSYNGHEINVYQFSGTDDLKLVLAHEFGHALGIKHVDEPEAIMYYLMGKQNIKTLELTDGDMDAVRSTCNL